MKYTGTLECNAPVDWVKKAAAAVAAPYKSLLRLPVRALITAAAVLTAGDILLTHIGLEHGYLAELNPLMDYLLQSDFGIYVLPVYLSLCFALLYYCAEAVRWLPGAMSVLVVIKIIILIQHTAILVRVFA